MKTYPIRSIWHRTVAGTELAYLTWDEVSAALADAGIIALIHEPGCPHPKRYALVQLDRFADKRDFRAYILNILRAAFPGPDNAA